jgi:EAL domain-containing protein (putative c-di-GMP-specific phosphodiesterase class I)
LPRRRDVWNRRFQVLPSWVHTLLVVVLLAGAWAVVYAAGGTRTAWPHVFYIPIIAAALPFGMSGGLAAGVGALLLCGPAMPLDVATGEAQQTVNWLLRGGFFITVGGVAGASTSSLRRSFASGLSRQLQIELELATAPDQGGDPGWELRVRQMLDREDFFPVFQPIYALDDGRLLAVEALTRFDTDPAFTPDIWFTEAAVAGLGVELELATAKTALETSAELDLDVALTLNASPALLTDPRLGHLLDWHRDRTVIVEVTEHAVVEDYQQLDRALTSLRRRGIQVAVDDAGAGFASFRHIVRLQPEFIKLDPSLTQNLRNDPVRRPLAEALLRFADQTGSRIIAEGIETSADLATWQELGAHAAQGYLLARPGPLPAPTTTDAIPQTRAHPTRPTAMRPNDIATPRRSAHRN